MGLFDSFLDPQQAGLFGVAQGLLQAGGPQRVPMGFGGALGQGLQGGLQAAQAAQTFKQQQALQALHQQLMSAQVGNYASEDAHRKALEAETQRKATEQANDQQVLQQAHQFALGTPTQVASNGTTPADLSAPPVDVSAPPVNPVADPSYHERRAQFLYKAGKTKLGDDAAKEALAVRKELADIQNKEGAAPTQKTVPVGNINGQPSEQVFEWDRKARLWTKQGEPRPIFNPNPLVNSTIENYPPPTAVTDPTTGKQKMVQFGKKGEIRETPYAPANGGQTPENSGKIAMLRQAESDIRNAESLLFDKEGNLNRTLTAAVNIPGTAGMPGYTDARTVYSAIENAVAAKLRLETGAAANAGEITNIANRFKPSPFDTSDSARDKLKRLREFMSSSLGEIKGISEHQKAPSESRGPGLTEAEQKELESLRKSLGK